MARRAASHILLQHKPYSFLSPSTNAKGNKQFASQLLVRKNLRNGAQWSADEPATMLPGCSAPAASTPTRPGS